MGMPGSKVRGACVAEGCSLRLPGLYLQAVREKPMCNTTKQRKADLAAYAHTPGPDAKMTHVYTTWALARLSAPLQRVAAKRGY